VNIPIAVLALGLAARLLHADAGRADAGRLDWTGLLLLSPGVAGIVFGLSETETHGGVTAPIAWVPILIGVVLVALFVRHATHAPRPLIDVRLFRATGFSAAAASTFLLAGALFGGLIVLPLYYQIDRGETALTAGLLMAPQGVVAALAMPLAGKLTDRVGGGRVSLARHRAARGRAAARDRRAARLQRRRGARRRRAAARARGRPRAHRRAARDRVRAHVLVGGRDVDGRARAGHRARAQPAPRAAGADARRGAEPRGLTRRPEAPDAG
jgi:hypothetical protein